jgi:uncharacterized membrane protein
VRFSPILLLHISAGTVGCLSGFVAVALKKGSRRHGLAGKVFAVSMLTLGASGMYLALLKSDPGTALGGALTFYFVATAWRTVTHKAGESGIFDWGALAVVLAIAATEVTFGVEAMQGPKGLKYGYPAPLYFIFGSLALLSFAGDVRMMVRGGISGTPRIARHLWRMCFAWFVASGSIFLARPHLFPVFMRKTGMLVLLSVFPLIMMIFWLIRVRFKNAYQTKPLASVAVSRLAKPTVRIRTAQVEADRAG